jgi:hypothetical protein
MSNEERRHFSRVAFNAPALLTLGDQQHVVSVLDLSFKGALVALPADLASTAVPRTGTGTLSLRLTGPDAGISMMVEVAHVQDGQVGLLCRGIDLDSMTHLRHLIELNLGDPALLQRDLKSLVST